eukprot:3514161-Alexandrium_andersonii.AAC.1
MACSNDIRSLQRVAKTQNNTAMLQKMQQEDPKQYSTLVRHFSKVRAKFIKENRRIKYSIVMFTETYTSVHGKRRDE